MQTGNRNPVQQRGLDDRNNQNKKCKPKPPHLSSFTSKSAKKKRVLFLNLFFVRLGFGVHYDYSNVSKAAKIAGGPYGNFPEQRLGVINPAIGRGK